MIVNPQNTSSYSFYPRQVNNNAQQSTVVEEIQDKISPTQKVASTKQSDQFGNQTDLSEEEKRELQVLKEEDKRVRTHEQAHKRAGGKYAGQIHYEFESGPDGQKYAVAGHTEINNAEIPNSPEKNIQKMEKIIKAALAPMSPSTTDRQIAAEARQNKMESQAELRKEKQSQVNEIKESESDYITSYAHSAYSEQQDIGEYFQNN